ncbi:MAG TPA: YkgJ family cysteine cluster protein [Rhizomicrobium sp.]
MELVPGRECGGCTICCSELHIDDPDLQKLAGVRCPNCMADSNCAIYDRRPKVCREFHCIWRMTGALDDDWRPDKSAILLMPKTTDIPPAYRGKDGVQLVILRQSAIYRQELHGLLAGLVSARTPLFLVVPTPPGFLPMNMFLNPSLEDPVRRQDGDGLVRALEAAIRTMARQQPAPMVFRNVPAADPVSEL